MVWYFRVWNVSESEAKFNYYLNFTRQVVNLNLNRKSLSNFDIYANDSSLMKINMLDLAMQVAKAFSARLNVHQEGYNSSKFNLSILEVGLCQTFGGVLSEYFSFSKSESATNFDPPQCYYTSASCYGLMELQNLFDGGKVYIHSPFEVATLESRYVFISAHRSVGLEFTSQEMLSADSVRFLSVAQRGCKFMEDVTYSSIPVYSYNICKMHCRKQLAIKFCNCSPYLYFHVDPVQVCDSLGLRCMQKHLKSILKFEDTNGSKIDCGCIPNCNEVLVTSFTDENTVWTNEVELNFSRYAWNIQKFSRERYIRNVLYNVEDFVVSVGSFVGLFLGGSLLSLVELFYFFTLRLFWYLQGRS
ncbi:unnamed protein product [Bemisia tabaci]|uniref:Sodium channel protein Nach n=1 Tax=Bemisia tabaci TaxID=7038 RepID=A0A9P0AI68_BEMTA|nr:unnamed protein product [Bemisia tabaci]